MSEEWMLNLDKTDSINVGGTQGMYTRMLKTQANVFEIIVRYRLSVVSFTMEDAIHCYKMHMPSQIMIVSWEF